MESRIIDELFRSVVGAASEIFYDRGFKKSRSGCRKESESAIFSLDVSRSRSSGYGVLFCSFHAYVAIRNLDIVYRQKSGPLKLFYRDYDFSLSQIRLSDDNSGYWEIKTQKDVDMAAKDIRTWEPQVIDFFDKFSSETLIVNELHNAASSASEAGSDALIFPAIYAFSSGEIEKFDDLCRGAASTFESGSIAARKIEKIAEVLRKIK